MLRKLSAVWAGLVVSGLILGSLGPSAALAFDTSSTNYINGGYYHNLVSDSDFLDINSMSVGAIQDFLVSKGSALASAPSDRLGNGANGRSAAQIIYDAAHGYGEASGTARGITVANETVSPRALLVTLQKEQSLITLTTLEDNRLRVATGYGCPDGGGCDERYYGFAHQVEWAAWQLRYNYEAAGKDTSWWQTHYPSQKHYRLNNVLSLDWAGTFYQVTMKNRATPALYRYTPHVGYGNFNFWRLMIDWFGISPITLGGNPEYSDDGDTISTATYKTVTKVSGSKNSSSYVYSEGTQIASPGDTGWTVEFRPGVGIHNYTIVYKNSSGTTTGTKLITIDRRKTGDVNGDVKVDLLDLSLMSDAWGRVVQDDASLNLNPETDNTVDLLDISLFATGFEG